MSEKQEQDKPAVAAKKATAVELLEQAAAILEAKRGKAGKTFAHVAAEVRKLIQRLESRGGA
jgi:hypothetical protein